MTMYIGVLNHPSSSLDVSARYCRRGTALPLEPDLSAGQSGEMPGWRWPSLMDVGVDVCYDLGKSCFIGAVCLTLAEGSAVQAVEILCGTKNEQQLCGRHDARTGETCGGAINITVGVMATSIMVRLRPLLTDVVLERLDLIGAIPRDEPLIYPTPAQTRFSGRTLARDRLAVIIRQDDSADTACAADYVREALAERFNLQLPPGDQVEGQRIGQPALVLRLDPDIQTEQYAIEVTDQGVLLTGTSRITLLYAIETFMQLARNGQIPQGQVLDRPYQPVRGFHFGLPPRESFDFYRRLLRHVLLPLRYNTLFIEFAGGMRFERHPEISEAWLRTNQAARDGQLPAFPHGEMVAGGNLLEKDEVRQLVDDARSLGFTVIPEVQSLSHVQYITIAHPEIAEVEKKQEPEEQKDTRAADQPPSTFYAHSCCPSDERSYAIICDIIDEIIDVVKPERYVHMGHDEVYQMALCPLCKGKDLAQLFFRHVMRLYDYLKQKGLGMMIWSDMLQPTERYQTHPAVDKLPRDIVLLDFIWYFHTDLDMEDHLLPHGYSVIMGNLYSSHYPRYESRAAKAGMTGGEVSSWCRFDEYTLAKKGKLFDLMYSAEMLWSARYRSEARAVYTEIIQKRIPATRDALRGLAGPGGLDKTYWPIPLPPAAEPGLPAAIQALVKTKPSDQAGIAGTAVCSAEAFDLSGARRLTDQPLEIAVQARCDRLVFLHTTTDNAMRVAWAPLTEVGVYSVHYADHTTIEIPVEYAGNIWHWARRYATPMTHPYYRHQGYQATYMADPLIQAKTENGTDLLVLGFEWINPYPEREITGICCRSHAATGADILLLAVTGVNTG